MKARHVVLSLAVCSTAFVPAGPAVADLKQGLAGAALGAAAVLGIQQLNKQNKQQAQPQATTSAAKKSSKPGVSAATVEMNKNIQRSLNYFGFNAGSVDGALGNQSRLAISQYQAFLGLPQSGRLDDEQQALLISTYTQATSDPRTQSLVAQLPNGPRGLLTVNYQQSQGIYAAPYTAPPTLVAPNGGGYGGMMAAAPGQAVPGAPSIAAFGSDPTPAAPSFAAAAAPVAPVAPPVVVAPTPSAGALPNFGASAAPASVPSFLAGSAAPSMATRCQSESGAAAATDADAILDQQFCFARADAVRQGDALIAKAASVSRPDIERQCRAFVPLLQSQINGLAGAAPAEAIATAASFASDTKMSPEQLKGTAEVCLGVGYSLDDADLALGSALVLTGLGAKPYAELVGYHLLRGYGTAPQPQKAVSWYGVALQALKAGTPPVFAPAMTDRAEVIEASLTALSGNGAPAPAAESGIPVFSVVH